MAENAESRPILSVSLARIAQNPGCGRPEIDPNKLRPAQCLQFRRTSKHQKLPPRRWGGNRGPQPMATLNKVDLGIAFLEQLRNFCSLASLPNGSFNPSNVVEILREDKDGGLRGKLGLSHTGAETIPEIERTYISITQYL
jgi:hypothetical protein